MVDNPFEPKPAGTSIGGTPMEHKETAKPDAPIRPDATNPDTNANVGQSTVTHTSRPEAEGNKWPAPLDSSKWNQPNNDLPNNPNRPNRPNNDLPEKPRPEPQDNYNPHPVTAGSAEDVEKSAGKYSGNVKPGMFIKVSPLNASDDDFVIGRIVSQDVSGLGQMVYIDESNELKLASFHAEDAEILYEVPEDKRGKKIFINDDQTYDARELRMERPRNEKQPVEKQNVLRDQTAKSQFNKSLTLK